MDEFRITIRLDQDNPTDAIYRDLLLGMGRRRSDFIRCLLDQYYQRFGGLGFIKSEEVPLAIRMIQTQGLFASAVNPVATTPVAMPGASTKSKKANKKKTVTNNKAVDTIDISAPAEVVSNTPVKAKQQPVISTPPAQVVPAPVMPVDEADDEFCITDEEFSAKSLEVAKKYILENFAKTEQQKEAFQLDWETTENIDGFEALYEELVINCTYLADPENKLPDGYDDMEAYADDQVKKQGYYINKHYDKEDK